jgi:hypothetical protein
MSTATRTESAAMSLSIHHGAARTWSAGDAAPPLVCIILVCLASSLPFLSILPGYFLSDDFGVVQLLAQKPPLHVLSLFTSPCRRSRIQRDRNRSRTRAGGCSTIQVRRKTALQHCWKNVVLWPSVVAY